MKRRISFVGTLHDVDHQPINRVTEDLRAEILKGMEEAGLPEPFFLDVPTFFDPTEGKEGIAFAFSKFDPRFRRDVGRHEFEYRNKEVNEVLKRIIQARSDLAPRVRWNSGFGVICFNLFFENQET